MTVNDKVKEIICTTLEISMYKLQGSTKLVDDLGADSLDVLELLMNLEDEFNLDIDDAMVENIVTVDEVCAFIQDKVDNK